MSVTVTKIQCKTCGKTYEIDKMQAVSGQPDTVLFLGCDKCYKELDKRAEGLHRCVMEDLR